MAERHISARELGLETGLAAGDEGALFKWLVASLLFGKPIQQRIAEQAYRVIVEQQQRDTPRKLSQCSKSELVRLLGQAHYVRYDFSTAERLLQLCQRLTRDYDGQVSQIRQQSANREEFEARLSAFNGIGPKTIEIFMRQAGAGLFPPSAVSSP